MAEGFVYSDRLMPTGGVAEAAKDFASAYTAKQQQIQSELKTKEQQALADLKAAKAQSDQYLKQSYKYDIAALPEFAREKFNGFLEEKRDEISDLLNESSEFSIGEAEKVISQISNMYNQIKGAIPESVTYQLDLHEALVDPAKLNVYNQQLGDFADASFDLEGIAKNRQEIFVDPEFEIVNGKPSIGGKPLQNWTANLSLRAPEFGPTINQVSPSSITDVAQSISDDMRDTKMDWNRDDAVRRTESLFKGKVTGDQKGARYALISALDLDFDSAEAAQILEGTWNQNDGLKASVQEQINNIVDMSKYGKAKTTTSTEKVKKTKSQTILERLSEGIANVTLGGRSFKYGVLAKGKTQDGEVLGIYRENDEFGYVIEKDDGNYEYKPLSPYDKDSGFNAVRNALGLDKEDLMTLLKSIWAEATDES